MAKKSLLDSRKDITNSCSILENAILSIALAEAHCHTGNRNGRLERFVFEKYVLQELALYYHDRGDMDERDDIASASICSHR
ncbi:hypothetical protein OSTOST_17698 [Ostertagia ostertagi]